MLCVFKPWQERCLDKVQEYQLIIPHCYYKQKRTFSFLPFILLHIAFCLFYKKLLATQIKKGSLINPKSALLCMWITSGAFITWLCSSGRNDRVTWQMIDWQRDTNFSLWECILFCHIYFWVKLWLQLTFEQGSCVWIISVLASTFFAVGKGRVL